MTSAASSKKILWVGRTAVTLPFVRRGGGLVVNLGSRSGEDTIFTTFLHHFRRNGE
jgi:hypothetical protein